MKFKFTCTRRYKPLSCLHNSLSISFFFPTHVHVHLGDNFLWVESTGEGCQQPSSPGSAAEEHHQTTKLTVWKESQTSGVSKISATYFNFSTITVTCTAVFLSSQIVIGFCWYYCHHNILQQLLLYQYVSLCSVLPNICKACWPNKPSVQISFNVGIGGV